jgi:hypothetical protein
MKPHKTKEKSENSTKPKKKSVRAQRASPLGKTPKQKKRKSGDHPFFLGILMLGIMASELLYLCKVGEFFACGCCEEKLKQ